MSPKLSFWLIMIIGALAIFSSIFLYRDGHDFNSYFWGGFCGLVLIGTAWNNQKQEQKKEK